MILPRQSPWSSIAILSSLLVENPEASRKVCMYVVLGVPRSVLFLPQGHKPQCLLLFVSITMPSYSHSGLPRNFWEVTVQILICDLVPVLYYLMRLKITTKNFVKVYIRLICVFLLQDNLSPLLFAKMVR